ncbi:protein-glutamine gamma-glutamyltransferase [Ectobacillus sp. sgz5001026]|uniref:protein-glutamine gamma-glutamyltransferase n=1 Tax=Ectobacillus sp. sgz5001026 TaxID=3242473 RepID=UPI0036D2F246
MIVMGRSIIHPKLLDDTELFFETKKQILESMTSNQEVYTYETLDQLVFDVHLRLHLLLTCIDLLSSGIQFRTFSQSFCHDIFWKRTKQGGFQVEQGVLPSVAINDIFSNGKKYGTECATAIIIIIYKSLLQCYDDHTFNRLFSNLLLFTWDYDKNLKLITKTDGTIIPGDITYFKNPQVDPLTIEWQGENTIYLGDDFHYGHGVGMSTSDQVINTLNLRRKPNAFLTAYITNFITRVDIAQMSIYASSSKIKSTIQFTPIRENIIIATAGHTTTVY